MWQIVWKMLRKRHRKKSACYIKEKYFTQREGNKWIFRCEQFNGKDEITLFQIAYIALKRYMVCKNLNPYHPENYEYFEKRRTNGSRHSILLGRVRSKSLKKQKAVCPVCNVHLLNGEKMEVHHIQSRNDGGNDKPRNLLLLHKECHKQITYSKDKQLRAVWIEKGILQN